MIDEKETFHFLFDVLLTCGSLDGKAIAGGEQFASEFCLQRKCLSTIFLAFFAALELPHRDAELRWLLPLASLSTLLSRTGTSHCCIVRSEGEITSDFQATICPRPAEGESRSLHHKRLTRKSNDLKFKLDFTLLSRVWAAKWQQKGVGGGWHGKRQNICRLEPRNSIGFDFEIAFFVAKNGFGVLPKCLFTQNQGRGVVGKTRRDINTKRRWLIDFLPLLGTSILLRIEGGKKREHSSSEHSLRNFSFSVNSARFTLLSTGTPSAFKCTAYLLSTSLLYYSTTKSEKRKIARCTWA
jgi:hypothetical protein